MFKEIGKMLDDLQIENDQLKAENKHLNDLLNQALNEIEAIQDAYEERE
jgi:predicted  nucleic acid-binding Zn-ribbon protein